MLLLGLPIRADVEGLPGRWSRLVQPAWHGPACQTPTWVADRTGHKSSAMINRYRRAARLASELNLGPLAPMDTAVEWYHRRLLDDHPVAGPGPDWDTCVDAGSAGS